MNKKNWPFILTGIYWILVLVAVIVNEFMRIIGKPIVDLNVFAGIIMVLAISGIMFSMMKAKGAMVGVSVVLLFFGIVWMLIAFIVSSDLSDLLFYLKASGVMIILGIPNFVALKAP